MNISFNRRSRRTHRRQPERNSGFPVRLAAFLLHVLCVLLFVPCSTLAADPVHATINKETAWTGEPVSLIITLYSPGPFSGTASFDLPELPRTAIIRTGSPVVGSETVDEDTWFTQRHELNLYTQRSGPIEIPSFRVQFSGKKTFTSDPEPMEGSTPKLQFQSNRPPGTDSMGQVTCCISSLVYRWCQDMFCSHDFRSSSLAEGRVCPSQAKRFGAQNRTQQTISACDRYIFSLMRLTISEWGVEAFYSARRWPRCGAKRFDRRQSQPYYTPMALPTNCSDCLRRWNRQQIQGACRRGN